MATGDSRRAIQVAALDLQKVNTALAQLSDWVMRLEGRSGDINLRDNVIIQSDKQSLIDFEAGTAGKASIAVFGTENATLALAKGARKENNGEWIATDTTAVIFTLSRDGSTNIYVNTSLIIGQAFNPTRSAANGFYGCRAYGNAATSINNDTITMLTFNSTEFDTEGTMHSTSTNTGRIVMPTAGYYKIRACINFTSDPDGYRLVRIERNSAGTPTTNNIVAFGQSMASATSGVTVEVNNTVHFAAADYIEVAVRHTAGAALDIGAGVSVSTPVVAYLYVIEAIKVGV